MKRNTSTATQRRSGLVVWLIILAGLFAAIQHPLTLSAQEKSFLWKISKEGKSIYLLGSIHYLKRENFPLRKPILDALANSKRLVLEIDLNSTSASSAQRATLEKAVYRDGSTLEQNIEPEFFNWRRGAQRNWASIPKCSSR